MRSELKINPGLAQWAVQAIARLLGTFAIAQGVNIVLTGDQRWPQNNAYQAALQVPGAPESWGIALGIAGVLTILASLAGRNRPTAWSLLGVCSWSAFFALSFLVSTLQAGEYFSAGVISYATLSVMAGTVATIYWNSHAYDDLQRASR